MDHYSQHLFPCTAHRLAEMSAVVAPLGALGFKWFMHSMLLKKDF